MEVRAGGRYGYGGELRLSLTKWLGIWQTDSVSRRPQKRRLDLVFGMRASRSMTTRTCPPSPHLRIDVSLRQQIVGAMQVCVVGFRPANQDLATPLPIALPIPAAD